MNQKRYDPLDAMRVAAIILVIFQHSCGTTNLELTLQSTAKVAVPLFLMITGFFYKGTTLNGRESNQIKKLFKYAVGTFAVYFVADFVSSILKGGVKEYILQYVEINNIVKFLLFNDPIAADFTWYLWATLYVLIISYYINRANKLDSFIKTIPMFMVLVLILGKYSPLIFDQALEYYYCRNFFTIGFLYFLLGYYLESKVNIINKIQNKYWGILSLSFILLGWGEYYLLTRLGINGSGYYITTTLISVSIFCFFYTINESKLIHYMASIGRKYVMPMYVTHSMLVKIEKKIFDMNSGGGWFGFIFVIIDSFCLCWIFFKTKDVLKRKGKIV